MNSLLLDIADRYKLRKGNGRWTGPCPKCGGSAKSDKFVLRDDGGFKCYSCPFKGDIITWLREMDDKSCPEAHEEAGRPCRTTSCPAAGKCRLGDGTTSTRRSGPRRLVPVALATQPRLGRSTIKMPLDIWCRWAEGFVSSCAENIPAKTLTWLAARGIDAAAAARFRIGWNKRSDKVSRAAIGLPPKRDKETLWLPAGLVIPVADESGRVTRIRIRRSESERERFLPDLKYCWLEGSGTGTMVIRPAGKSRGAVIVEAELDGDAIAAAHDGVMVVALGTVSVGLDDELRAELATQPVILVALDADEKESGKKTAAGPVKVGAWLSEYAQARFWPVPQGKDPGEYVACGGDLYTWVEAGLIPDIPTALKPSDHDLNPLPESASTGGEGGINNAPPVETEAILLAGRTDTGREYSVTTSREIWQQKVEAGQVVFSAGEIQRLHKVVGGDDQGELIMDIKDIFPGAYIGGSRTNEETKHERPDTTP